MISKALGLVLVASLAGCGVVPPRVQYAKAPVASSNEATSAKTEGASVPPDFSGYLFRQRRSILLVSFDAAKAEFKVAAAPYELDGNGQYLPLYTMTGGDDYRSTTQLKVKYVDNTRFVDEMGVTTKDNIADTISKIGELGKALVPVVSAMVSATKGADVTFRPTMLDPASSESSQFQPDPLNEGYCIRMRDLAVESRLTLDQYVSSSASAHRSTFPVPACATALIDIASSCSDPKKVDPAKLVTVRATFAHFDAVVPTPLPSTGSLKMNSICGASVTEADKEDRYDLLKYLQGAVTAGQSVHTDWKKAKDAKKKP